MDQQQINDLIDQKIQNYFENIGKIKYGDLPKAQSTEGLITIGIDSEDRSVQVPMNLVRGKDGDPLTVVKSYTTEALALADKNPIHPQTGAPLAIGQFVSITTDPIESKNAIYRIGSFLEDGTMVLQFQGRVGSLVAGITAVEYSATIYPDIL